MKILFVNKQGLFPDGIADLLAKSAHDLIEQANTIGDALSYFSGTEFSILITNFNQVDDHGLRLIRKVKLIYPNLRIIVLSMQDEDLLARQIIKDNIKEYVFEKASPYDISRALNVINGRLISLSVGMNKIISGARNQNTKGKLLSARETEVLKLLSYGYSIKQISEKLELAEKTIASHNKNLFKKTKTTTLSGLLKYTYANNLI